MQRKRPKKATWCFKEDYQVGEKDNHSSLSMANMNTDNVFIVVWFGFEIFTLWTAHSETLSPVSSPRIALLMRYVLQGQFHGWVGSVNISLLRGASGTNWVADGKTAFGSTGFLITARRTQHHASSPSSCTLVYNGKNPISSVFSLFSLNVFLFYFLMWSYYLFDLIF